MNGLGAQGNPRGARCPNPVTYPFKGINGITVHRQTAGPAHLGHQHRRRRAVRPLPRLDRGPRQGRRRRTDGKAITEDMTRGPEAYLQMWERAEGITPDSCRNPSLRQQVSAGVSA